MFLPFGKFWLTCFSLLLFAYILGFTPVLWLWLWLGFGLFVTFFFSFWIQANFYLPGVHKLSSRARQVALTFDDGPDPVLTPKILDLLQEANVKATFFCIGQQISKHPEIVRRISEEGHHLGNHSFSHTLRFTFSMTPEVISELTRTNELIGQLSGTTPILFRPPFGVTNPHMAFAVKQVQMKILGWSLRSYDTVIKDSRQLLERLQKETRPGAIVLFHDTQEHLLDVLPAYISFLKQHDYEVVLPK